MLTSIILVVGSLLTSIYAWTNRRIRTRFEERDFLRYVFIAVAALALLGGILAVSTDYVNIANYVMLGCFIVAIVPTIIIIFSGELDSKKDYNK